MTKPVTMWAVISPGGTIETYSLGDLESEARDRFITWHGKAWSKYETWEHHEGVGYRCRRVEVRVVE